MFDNLRKKKLLESLGVNKVAPVNPPNEPEIKTVQNMKDNGKSFPNPKHFIEGDSMEEAGESKEFEVSEDESIELKKKKMLGDLFKGKK